MNPIYDTGRRIKGSLMGIAVQGPDPEVPGQIIPNFVSCETNAEMYFEKGFIPASSPESGKFERNIPEKRRWRMNVDGNLLLRQQTVDLKTLYDAWFNDTLLTIEFRTRPWVEQYLIFRGEAYVELGGALGPNRGLATWNIQFKGDGILNMDWEEFWLMIDAMPPQADWPTIVEEDPNLWVE